MAVAPDIARVRAAATARGKRSEDIAAERLAEEGWTIIGRRVRTPAGELDLVAARNGLVAFVEVKQRRRLVDAAHAVAPGQQRRIVAAASVWLSQNPGSAPEGVRFDVVVLDRDGQVRRIADAFRAD